MRRPALLLVLAAVAGGAAWLTTRDPGAPFPTAGHVQSHGLAAWPADTVTEAKEECDGAPAWRRDPKETALRFASDVMGYPDPVTSDWTPDETPDTARFLMNTGGVGRVFLGSLLELRRHGYCWYVVDGEPREDGPPEATIAFVDRDGETHLLMGSPPGLTSGEVGFGEWEAEIDPGLRQTVIEMPPVDPGATGHAIYLRPDDRGISEGVGVETLGSIPPPPAGPPAAPLPAAAVDSGCTGPAPRRVIRELFGEYTVDLLREPVAYPPLSRHLGGKRWRVNVDGAALDAVIDGGTGCARLVSIAPAEGDRPLRRLWLGDRGATVEVDWRGRDDAYVWLGTAETGAGGALERLSEPVTFPWSNGPPATRVSAFAIVFEEGRVVSASYDVYPAPGSS